MTHGTIFIDQERCKGCELCTMVCPKDLIVMDEDTLNAKGYHLALLVDPDGLCTGCGVCAIMCPDVCISVYREPQPERRARTVV